MKYKNFYLHGFQKTNELRTYYIYIVHMHMQYINKL